MDPINALLFKKPFALSVGPTDCGERQIQAYLQSRSDVCLPSKMQELYFFDRLYDRGIEFYAAHFSPTKNHRLMAEITTTLFDHDLAPTRVKECFGQKITLICPLKNPIDHAISLYTHFLSYGLVHGSLREACFQEPAILHSSHYARYLTRWMDVFGKKHVKLLFQEQLKTAPEQFYNALCLALGLDYQEPAKTRMNVFKSLFAKKPKIPSISAPDLEWLTDQLGSQATELEKLIGTEIPYWHS